MKHLGLCIYLLLIFCNHATFYDAYRCLRANAYTHCGIQGSWDGGCKCGEELWQTRSECLCGAILEPGATVVFEGQWTFYVDFVYPYDSKKLFYPLW